jgi:hypothetical protein
MQRPLHRIGRRGQYWGIDDLAMSTQKKTSRRQQKPQPAGRQAGDVIAAKLRDVPNCNDGTTHLV